MTSKQPQTATPRTERVPVRIKVYGGGLSLLPPGTDWRVTRITEHVAPGGLIGEVMPEWTIIDLDPIEARAAGSGGLDVERLHEANQTAAREGFIEGNVYDREDLQVIADIYARLQAAEREE